MAKNFLMTLKLTNFLDSRIIDVDDADGFTETGVFIPLDKNGLKETKHHEVYVNAFVTEKQWDTGDGSTHYIRQKNSVDFIKARESLGYKAPYLGSMRSSSYQPTFQTDFAKRKIGRVKTED